jgi:hypothetical protein
VYSPEGFEEEPEVPLLKILGKWRRAECCKTPLYYDERALFLPFVLYKKKMKMKIDSRALLA